MIRGPFRQHKATNSEASVCVKWTSRPFHRGAVHPGVVCFLYSAPVRKTGRGPFRDESAVLTLGPPPPSTSLTTDVVGPANGWFVLCHELPCTMRRSERFS